jgi:hypothetical protein
MHTSFLDRVAATFAQRRGDTLVTMALNLVRFFAWQNIALLPLFAASIVIAIRDRGLAAAMLLGVAGWLVFIAVVIPFQGHGWGYRYLHPYLGSFALLAGFGYNGLREAAGSRIDGVVITLSAVTAVVTIPLLLTATYRFLAPYVALERLVAAQRAPMVLIDTSAAPTTNRRWSRNAIETVRNLPDLSNVPLRFASDNLSPQQLSKLCAKGKIVLISRADQHRVGFALNVSARSPSFEQLVDPVRRKYPSCFMAAAA